MFCKDTNFSLIHKKITEKKEKRRGGGKPLRLWDCHHRTSSRILSRSYTDDDEFHFDILCIGLGIKGCGSGAFDFCRCHARNADMVFRNAVFDKEFLNRNSPVFRHQLVMLGVDAIGVDITLDEESDIGMVLEHLDIVHENGVGLTHQFRLVREIDIADGVLGTTLGTVHADA